jgi:hypothetical protein
MHAAGASPLLAYNVLFLLGMFLSALSAWALARFVTRDALASLFAGVVYAFLPWRMSQIPHIQFQWGAFLALLLLFLLRYLEGGARRDAVLFGVAFGWNVLANVLTTACFSGFLVGVALLLPRASGESRPRAPDPWRAVSPRRAGALGTLRAVCDRLPQGGGAVTTCSANYGEMETFSGTWTDFLSAGREEPFLGTSDVSVAQNPRANFFPGLIALALGRSWLWRTVRRARDADSGAIRRSRPHRRRAPRSWLGRRRAAPGGSVAGGTHRARIEAGACLDRRSRPGTGIA